jgi:hypothetical protein
MAQELPSALEIKLWQSSRRWLRKRAESSALVMDYVKQQVRFAASNPDDCYAPGVLTTLRQARQPASAPAPAAHTAANSAVAAPAPAAHTAANLAAAAVVSSSNSSDGAACGKQRPTIGTSRAAVKVKVLAYDPSGSLAYDPSEAPCSPAGSSVEALSAAGTGSSSSGMSRTDTLQQQCCSATAAAAAMAEAAAQGFQGCLASSGGVHFIQAGRLSRLSGGNCWVVKVQASAARTEQQHQQ